MLYHLYIYISCIYIWFYTFHPVAIAGLSKPGPKTVLPTPQSPIDIGGESFRGVYVLHIYIYIYTIIYYIILYYIILYHIMLYYVIVYYILKYIILYYVILCYIMLYYV